MIFQYTQLYVRVCLFKLNFDQNLGKKFVQTAGMEFDP
jgi:hypothetical protein